jgi:hypothetical protein
MQVEKITFTDAGGWQAGFPGALDSPSTLVLAFGSPDCARIDEALAELRAAFPQAIHVGCSTSGEISAGEILDGSLTVALTRFDRTGLLEACTPIRDPADSRDAGLRLGARLKAPGLRAVLLLSDGLSVNGAQLVDGLNAAVGPGVTVVGGLAGDGERFSRTWVLCDGERRAGQVVAVGLFGEALRINAAAGGGWSDFGPERQITRAAGQILYELDGRPALDLYKDYLGEFARDLPGAALRFPLLVKSPQPGAEPLVRTVLGIDESTRSMTFAGDIPQGGTARLMRASHSRLVDAAGQAATAAAPRSDSSDEVLVLTVSCVGRRIVMGQHAEDELEAVAEVFPEGCVNIGFYSYGEIAPAGGTISRLHNQTIGVTVIREAPP